MKKVICLAIAAALLLCGCGQKYVAQLEEDRSFITEEIEYYMQYIAYEASVDDGESVKYVTVKLPANYKPVDREDYVWQEVLEGCGFKEINFNDDGSFEYVMTEVQFENWKSYADTIYYDYMDTYVCGNFDYKSFDYKEDDDTYYFTVSETEEFSNDQGYAIYDIFQSIKDQAVLRQETKDNYRIVVRNVTQEEEDRVNKVNDEIYEKMMDDFYDDPDNFNEADYEFVEPNYTVLCELNSSDLEEGQR